MRGQKYARRSFRDMALDIKMPVDGGLAGMWAIRCAIFITVRSLFMQRYKMDSLQQYQVLG